VAAILVVALLVLVYLPRGGFASTRTVTFALGNGTAKGWSVSLFPCGIYYCTPSRGQSEISTSGGGLTFTVGGVYYGYRVTPPEPQFYSTLNAVSGPGCPGIVTNVEEIHETDYSVSPTSGTVLTPSNTTVSLALNSHTWTLPTCAGNPVYEAPSIFWSWVDSVWEWLGQPTFYYGPGHVGGSSAPAGHNITPYKLLYDPNSGAVLASSPATDQILGYDVRTGALTTIVNLTGSPLGLAYDPKVPAILAATNGSGIFELNPTSYTLIKHVNSSGILNSIMFDKYNGRVYVTNSSGGAVDILNGSTLSLIHNVSVGVGPVSIAAVPGGAVYVVCFGSNVVAEISPGGNVSRWAQTGTAPISIIFDPVSNHLLVSNFGSKTLDSWPLKLPFYSHHPVASAKVGPLPTDIVCPSVGDCLVPSMTNESIVLLNRTSLTIDGYFSMNSTVWPTSLLIHGNTLWVSGFGNKAVVRVTPIP
jgi:YVTN family beta-propeller protein